MFVKLSVLILVFVLIPLAMIDGQVRSSSNYQLERDSLNVGGALSTSTNYGLEDTAGEIATGRSTSTNYVLQAGYQQQDSVFITITSPADVNMTAINGLTGGVSTSSATWTVTTNNAAGYQVSVKASTSPALASSLDSFIDYVPTGAAPDFSWSIASTTAGFGYSVESVDVATRFKDNGSSCNTGSSNANDSCWDGFSTTSTTIVSRATNNLPSGTDTRLELYAESGASHILTAGSYSAVLTVTAVAL